jgi:hypothetical protein
MNKKKKKKHVELQALFFMSCNLFGNFILAAVGNTILYFTNSSWRGMGG